MNDPFSSVLIFSTRKDGCSVRMDRARDVHTHGHAH